MKHMEKHLLIILGLVGLFTFYVDGLGGIESISLRPWSFTPIQLLISMN